MILLSVVTTMANFNQLSNTIKTEIEFAESSKIDLQPSYTCSYTVLGISLK